MASKIQKPSNMFAFKLFSTFACLLVDCQNWASNTARTHLVNHMWQAERAFVVPVAPFATHTSQMLTSQENPPEAKTRLTVSVFSFSGQLRSQKDLGFSGWGLQIIQEMLRLIVLLLRVCHRGRLVIWATKEA